MMEEPKIVECVRWWEKRRLYYCLALIITMVIIRVFNPGIENSLGSMPFVEAIFFFFFANAAYTIGWVLEILLSYYFKMPAFEEIGRYYFYFIGTALSLFVLWMNFYV